MNLRDMIMAGTVICGVVLLAAGSFGQDRVSVPLPDLSGLDQDAARDLARSIGQADVITSNCADYKISGGEWTLLAGTADLLAKRLGLDPAAYDQEFNAPAYALLDDPAACDRLGPEAGPLIGRLVDMGGATEPAKPPNGEPDPADPRQPAAAAGAAAESGEDG